MEALETLAKTRGDRSKNDTGVLMEFYEIKQNITFEQKLFKQHPYKRIFSKGYENNRKRLILGVAAQAFQQLTGVTALLYVVLNSEHVLDLMSLIGYLRLKSFSQLV